MSTPSLTQDELVAMHFTAELANAFGRIVGDGQTRMDDLSEAVHHIHALQHMIMSQAAARAYPSRFRLLGESLATQTPAPAPDSP